MMGAIRTVTATRGAAPRVAYGAHRSPFPPPRPDLGLARDCEHCLGWGTLVTRDGEHELCQTCQPDPLDGENGPGSAS